MAGDRAVTPLLRVVDSDAEGRVLELRGETTIIGRNPDCDIVLDNDTVSKKHARIRRDGHGFVIADMGSRNHTWVNGRRITAQVALNDGDRIGICEYQFVFELPGPGAEEEEDDTSTILISMPAMPKADLALLQSKPGDKLLAVLEISREVANTLHLHEVLDKTLAGLFKLFQQADRGLIEVAEWNQPGFAPRSARTRLGGAEEITTSKTVKSLVLGHAQSILSASVKDDPRLGQSQSLQGSEIRTIMCVPLLDHLRRPIGLIQLDTHRPRCKFTQEDLDLLVSVSSQVGLAIENARLHHLSLVEASLKHAHSVQMAMVPGPEHRPNAPGYEFWDVYVPALQVGGDYFGYQPLTNPETPDAPPRHWAVTVGDVSDKGMPAALVMARLSSEVRLCLTTEADPVKVVERLNHLLYDARFPERFVTFMLVVLDTHTHQLTVVSAGHMGPTIRRAATNTIETLGEGGGGLALGIEETSTYSAIKTQLEPGDVVVMFTDGVNEAMGPGTKCFRLEGIYNALRHAPPRPSQAGEAILQAIRGHVAGMPQSDDLTLMCFGRV